MAALKIVGLSVEDIFAGVKANDEKSFPAQVFLNHFKALSHHIENDRDAYDLTKVRYFMKRLFKKPGLDEDRVRKVLYNSWSTEYALRLTGLHGNNDYCRFAMHWSFPQAYYSCYLSLHAFSLTVGIDDNSHEQLIKSFGQGIITNKYPPCTSFYCDGELKSFNLVGLPLQTQKNGLAGIHDATDAQSQIASFLKSTRKSKAQYHREKLQASAAAIVNRKGEKLKTFKAENWKSITDKLGPTTIFDMLYRLRIKANYRDVQTFMEADIDFLAVVY